MRIDKQDNIFIHSLFRSGSTYLFSVFRRSASGYWAYQEPFHEYLIKAASEPDRLGINNDKTNLLRHPKLKKPFFYEFFHIANKIESVFEKEFSYDYYFIDYGNPNKQVYRPIANYFNILAEEAKGRPVFQCCRSTGRIKFLKEEMGGFHIFLWRNPWDQWWSYEVSNYFEICNMLITNGQNVPDFLIGIKHGLNIPGFHDADIYKEFDFFARHNLNPNGSYLLFYAIWCHAMLEAMPNCDISINIDSLSKSSAYRDNTILKLKENNIDGIDFSDARSPQSSYSDADIDFFKKIEEEVHIKLMSHGFKKEQIEYIMQLREEHYGKYRNENRNNLLDGEIKNLGRLREAAYRYKTDLSHFMHISNELQYQLAESGKYATALEVQLAESGKYATALEVQLAESGKYATALEVQLAESGKYATALEVQLAESGKSVEYWRAISDNLNNELNAIYNSKSWRATEFLRKLKKLSLKIRFLFKYP